MRKILIPIWITALMMLFSQETTVKETTEIYSQPGQKPSIGQLNPGTIVTKLKKDQSGKYIKATIEFYIPAGTLEDSQVSLPVGSEQVADKAKYKLLSAQLYDKRVKIELQVSNFDMYEELVFSSMTMLKVTGGGGNKGELDPFEGKYQDLAIIKPLRSVVAELFYDFKTPPKNVNLTCKSKLGGEQVMFTLGF